MRIKQLIVVGSFLLATTSHSVVDYASPGGVFAKGKQLETDSAVQAFPCPLVLSKLFRCKPMGLRASS